MQIGAFILPNDKFVLLLGEIPYDRVLEEAQSKHIIDTTGCSLVLASADRIEVLGDEVQLPQDMVDKVMSIVEGRDTKA